MQPHKEVVSAVELYALLEDVIDPLEVAAEALAKLHALGLPGVINQADIPEVSNAISLDEHRDKVGAASSGNIAWGDETLTNDVSPMRGRPSSRVAITPESLMHGGNFTLQQRKLMGTYASKVEQAAATVRREWRLELAELDEVISDGYVGLIKATLNYDSEKSSGDKASGFFWNSKKAPC